MAKKIGFVGCQNGDEGKGKIVEYIIGTVDNSQNQEDFVTKLMAKRYGQEKRKKKILTYRYQGGGNAGHTVKIGEKTYKLHQINSGIVNPATYCLLGKGMFLNPRKLVQEIKTLIQSGTPVTQENLGISSKVHITLDYHTHEDQADFNLAEHKCTGNGIRQTARDKANRTGIRFVEFLDKNLMLQILKEKVFPKGLPEHFGTFEEFVDSYENERRFLAPFLVQEHEIFKNPQFEYWVAEGAQGVMLDIEEGQYPGVTSSNPALPTHRPDIIVGVFKLYVSSVGIGDRPFVTEIPKELQERLVQPWNEFGTTTGKPRHLGWFDVVQAKYALDVAELDYISATNLDKLELLHQMGQKVKICVGYNLNGKIYRQWDASFDHRDVLKNVVPVYEELDSWEKTTLDGKTLTPNAQKYIDRIEQLVGKKFILIGIGPEHNQIVVRNNV